MNKLTTMILILAIGLSSCTHYYYMPNVQSVPLFKEKNEYRISVASNGGYKIYSTEVQAAYSVTNNWAVMTNFMFAKGRDVSKNSLGKGKYIDGAIGYYKPLDKFAVFEIYGGFGASRQHHQYGKKNYDHGTADLSFTKLFLQPSIGLTFNAFDVALSTRLCNLSFYKINNQIDRSYSEYYYLDTIAQNKQSYLFEPAFTVRGGWKYGKVQMQLVSLKNLTNPNLRFDKSYGSIGLYITIAKRYWTDIPKKTGNVTEEKK